MHSSTIELSGSALRNNLRFLRKLLGPEVAISSVVKGNAYGHSIEHFVPLAEDCGIGHFSVFSADEALRVLESRTRPDTRICIMGYIDDAELEWAVGNGIEFWVFDCMRLSAAERASERIGKPARVHLELETGMNRLGLQGAQLDRAIETLATSPGAFELCGVCTHFAGAESVQNHLRIRNQIEAFWEGHERISRRLGAAVRHTACSAAALRYAETRMDMVRIGIAQYGFWPSRETRMHFQLERDPDQSGAIRDPLRRVMRWKSLVMNVKTVGPGQFVGYGTTYLTTRTEKVAAVPVGYHHGFARNLSNLGHVLVHGRRAQVVGLVNMNMFLVDVTDIPSVDRGDEVVIIGKQNRSQITVSSFSDLTRNLNYEVLVSLPESIPRVVVA
ncbi:MAG: alanine racemase [Deltaproteobacteria bacterium]|nr:alanine racemase [Deltaproteobacteria bacterium]